MKEEYLFLEKDQDTEEESLRRLITIVSILRRECPWDRVQTHKSLRPGMIEEAYEVVDAIDRDNFVNLREELGDVLLQVVFHSLLGKEEEEFDLNDVINGICNKMIRRHDHVFSDVEAKTIDKVLGKWENVKSKEHGNNTYTQRLQDVPKTLPALTKAAKVQKRAADGGFDWKEIDGPLQKVAEEFEELQEAIVEGDRNNIDEELGDLLFSVVNVSRHIGVNPEFSLNKAVNKFVNRFSKVEEEVILQNKKMEDMTLDELDDLWNRNKL